MRLAVLTVILFACDAPPPRTCVDDTEPVVEVGTGVDAFHPIDAHTVLPIADGPQGGFHVWGAARIQGLADEPYEGDDTLRGTATWVLLQAETSVALGAIPRVPVPRNDHDEDTELFGVTVFMPHPTLAAHQKASLELTVYDACGNGWRSARNVKVGAFSQGM